ncbi:MAG: NADH-quinone oxidoreductase subunit N, partial [bacterium]
FSALIDTGDRLLLLLAFIGVLNSVISLFYYARVIKHMFLNEPKTEQKISIRPVTRALLVSLGASVLILGVAWSSVYSFTDSMMVFV